MAEIVLFTNNATSLIIDVDYVLSQVLCQNTGTIIFHIFDGLDFKYYQCASFCSQWCSAFVLLQHDLIKLR